MMYSQLWEAVISIVPSIDPETTDIASIGNVKAYQPLLIDCHIELIPIYNRYYTVESVVPQIART